MQSQGAVNYYIVNGDVVLTYPKQLYLHYLEMPLGIKVNLNTAKRFTPFIEVGVGYQLLLYANVNPQRYFLQHNVTANCARNNISVFGGAGISTKIGNNFSINLAAKYNQGLLNINKTESNKSTQLFIALVGLIYNINTESTFNIVQFQLWPH